MRIASILLLTAATLSVQQQSLFAQTSVRLLTGPTSFTGSSNLEDGIQISGTGTYSSQIALSTSVRPCISIETQAQWGELGLTAANRKNEMATYQSASAGVRLHLPHNQERHLQPWISIGAAWLKQSNFADLLDAENAEYQVWDNGMIYDMAEDAPYADAQANPMMRDYTFETRTATSHNLAIPLQIGLDLNLTTRLFASASISTLMGAEASLDPRPDHLDWLTTAQAGIGIRLGKAHAEPKGEAFPEALVLLGDDADSDGVKDSKDRCPGTMAGAPIDKHGCALDSDKDGIADYKDAEPHSTHRRSERTWRCIERRAMGRSHGASNLQIQRPSKKSFNALNRKKARTWSLRWMRKAARLLNCAYSRPLDRAKQRLQSKLSKPRKRPQKQPTPSNQSA